MADEARDKAREPLNRPRVCPLCREPVEDQERPDRKVMVQPISVDESGFPIQWIEHAVVCPKYDPRCYRLDLSQGESAA